MKNAKKKDTLRNNAKNLLIKQFKKQMQRPSK